MPIADVMIFVVENPARVANEHRPSKRRVMLNKNFKSLEGLLNDDNKLSRVCAQSYLNRAPRCRKRSAQREREGSKWMRSCRCEFEIDDGRLDDAQKVVDAMAKDRLERAVQKAFAEAL